MATPDDINYLQGLSLRERRLHLMQQQMAQFRLQKFLNTRVYQALPGEHSKPDSHFTKEISMKGVAIDRQLPTT